MYKFVAYLGMAMSLFFIFAGVYVAAVQFLPAPPPLFSFTWTYFEAHPAHFNYLIAALLIAYGAFRFYRSVKTLRENEA